MGLYDYKIPNTPENQNIVLSIIEIAKENLNHEISFNFSDALCLCSAMNQFYSSLYKEEINNESLSCSAFWAMKSLAYSVGIFGAGYEKAKETLRVFEILK